MNEKLTNTAEYVIIDNAVKGFEKHTSIEVTIIITGIGASDTTLEIQGKRFLVEVKGEIRDNNKELVVAQIKAHKSDMPWIVIAKFISKSASKYLAENGINYIDVAGNCNIKYDDILLIVEGKRKEKEKVAKPKAFRGSAGLKLIYQLLLNPDNVNSTYRELSEMAGISLGSVGDIINELIGKNFILQTDKKKVLKNLTELLDKWIWSYHEVLRPKLIIARMNFTPRNDWQNAISGFDDTLWGGESAAAIITKQIKPQIYTVYTKMPSKDIAAQLKLLPTGDENFEILEPFFKIEQADNKCVAPLLVYADLMNSSSDRNIEIAKTIRENELQYIK